MPETTLSEIENKIRAERPELPRTTVRKLAKREKRELQLWAADTTETRRRRTEAHLNNLAGGRVHEFRDPTPAEAFANMRRCARE